MFDNSFFGLYLFLFDLSNKKYDFFILNYFLSFSLLLQALTCSTRLGWNGETSRL